MKFIRIAQIQNLDRMLPIPTHSLHDRYILRHTLGDGSFGDVWLAQPTDQTLNIIPSIQQQQQPTDTTTDQIAVAVKTIRTKLSLNNYTTLREVEFLNLVSPSPYLIKTFEIFVDDRLKLCHIVMEAMKQNLWQLIQSKKETFYLSQIRHMLYQIVCGVSHIHTHGFYHRDIKPENILVRYSTKKSTTQIITLKIADFGLSRFHNCRDPYTSYVSTRWYRAPELLLKVGSYSFSVDIWAFGVLAAELVNLQPLFPGDSEPDQINHLLSILGTPRSNCYGGNWVEFYTLINQLGLKAATFPGIETPFKLLKPSTFNSPSLAMLINSCLRWNPLMRPSSLELLQHAFFKTPVGNNIQPQTHTQTQSKQLQGSAAPQYNNTRESLVSEITNDNANKYYHNFDFNEAITRLDNE